MIEHPIDDEIRLTQWFDGELSDAEISDLLAKDPDLCRQKKEIERIGELVRLNAASEVETDEPPFPELFNRQVLRRIQETPATHLRTWLETAHDWFTGSQWGVSAAAMVALTGILLSGTKFGSSTPTHSEVVHTFAPHPQHHATAEYLPLASATIIRLDGLEAMNPKASITGYFQNDLNPNQRLASTVIYRHDGQPIVMQDDTAPASLRLPSWIQLASTNER
jgi:hypothetical protein